MLKELSCQDNIDYEKHKDIHLYTSDFHNIFVRLCEGSGCAA